MAIHKFRSIIITLYAKIFLTSLPQDKTSTHTHTHIHTHTSHSYLCAWLTSGVKRHGTRVKNRDIHLCAHLGFCASSYDLRGGPKACCQGMFPVSEPGLKCMKTWPRRFKLQGKRSQRRGGKGVRVGG